jgi:hypothetical protein
MSEIETTAVVLLAVTSPISVLVMIWTIRLLFNSGLATSDPPFANGMQFDRLPERLRSPRSPHTYLRLVKCDGSGI